MVDVDNIGIFAILKVLSKLTCTVIVDKKIVIVDKKYKTSAAWNVVVYL